MWMSAVAVIVMGLSTAQPGKLSAANERLTFGHLGPVRDSNKFLPGDVVFLSFQVENMTFDPNGKATYSVGLDLADPKGAGIFKQQPRTASTRNYLGGTSVPCAANLQVPLETPPGVYTFCVTVVDNASKGSVTVERKIEILPKGFGLVHVGTSADANATIAWSPIGVVGDSIYLNFSAVGFARDKATKHPNIQVSMRVLDDKGQPTGSAKMTGEAKSDVPESMAVVPMQFGITLNRTGSFTLELTATDVLTGTSTK
ncbi:MAG TPA: hypothetical protein VE988_20290, partial [Gemmataceae bacterium]|nr:hypothetical protein [Gemmataceae bacterium]